MNSINGEVPIKSPKGKGKAKGNSKGQQGGLQICTPIEFPKDPGLGPEIPLYTAQQYWEDLVYKKMVPPDFTGRNQFRYTPIQY